MELYKLIKPVGILTYTLLFLTVISGKFRWKLKSHVALAVCAIILATVHALIIILSD